MLFLYLFSHSLHKQFLNHIAQNETMTVQRTIKLLSSMLFPENSCSRNHNEKFAKTSAQWQSDIFKENKHFPLFGKCSMLDLSKMKEKLLKLVIHI